MSTACTAASRRVDVAPRASVPIESMREIGYSLPTAVADIVDNSLAAGARRIDLLADTDSGDPSVAILDDGAGMTPDRLIEGKRPVMGLLGFYGGGFVFPVPRHEFVDSVCFVVLDTVECVCDPCARVDAV